MSFPFDPYYRAIVIEAEVLGPSGSVVLSLALDTGATTTVISEAWLVGLGYDPTQAPAHVRAITASGVVLVPEIRLTKLTALGHDRINFPVLCHTLPSGAAVNGVLGLDFLRGRILTIDFQAGQITLS